ncbi:hypothetical protein [Amycolatopsis sp. FDAARGOS 1241]|uniref:hypothetical protein n=1 Tax=Amycolatopsis sp. FDAARGOS 1241 TaxID=2778070 RepID=UPI0019509A04|nr:hypothetical protein [Amycolatopsis sp. FDAARGOS 1241]QRP43021.1 hypothetical protein I6J71_26680 [Amycolatopsis sp. FDAARGOS 1241]
MRHTTGATIATTRRPRTGRPGVAGSVTPTADVQVQSLGASVVLAARGEFDVLTVPTLQEALEQALAGMEPLFRFFTVVEALPAAVTLRVPSDTGDVWLRVTRSATPVVPCPT